MKKNVEIGINLLFWTLLMLFIVYQTYWSTNDLYPDPASPYHITYGQALWDTLSNCYRNGLLGFIIGFYVFYCWVVPVFVKSFRNRFIWLIIPLGWIVSSIPMVVFSPTLARLTNVDEWHLWAPTVTELFVDQWLRALAQVAMIMCLSILLKTSLLWANSIAEKKALQKKQLESENALLVLKAQLNPHFLFNSLNNIDVLMEESVPKASDYLKKLSDILRYVLYETKEDTTTLAKELEQVENYIELQKIRTSNTAFVRYEVVGALGDQSIAPMLFLPFVENAFKFSKNKSINQGVQIRFEVQPESVRMLCKNRFEQATITVQKSEGLGIETIRKRLEWLYPKRYRLNIDASDGWFTVDLCIPLNHAH